MAQQPAAGMASPGGNAGVGGSRMMGNTPDAQGGDQMPCAIDTLVTQSCQTCHGARPIGGAPMPLVTLEDWQRDYTVTTTEALRGQTMKVHEIAKIRVNGEMGTGRMPQGRPLEESDLGMLNQWLTSGSPAGMACSGGMAGAGGAPVAGAGGAGMGGNTVRPSGDQCTGEGVYDPLVATAEETCYEFRTHGVSGPNDTSKFRVPPDESYSQFYFKVPWEDGTLATRFGTDFDNIEVLHHWLAFASRELRADGDVVPNVLGTTLFTDAELIAGWAVGGCTTTFPDDVGVRLRGDGIIMVQWHHYNNSPTAQEDGSAVQICTVPAGSRPNVAGLTFLGTETMSVPPGQRADASGTCVNDSGGPITIIGFTPHMHEIGVHMKSVVQRGGVGEPETVFDEPFQFDYQTNYMMDPPIVLMPGDSITSTCTYQNQGARTVGFGQSTKSEMCYQFALAYPYGELNNGVISLIGATNTCW